MSAPLLQGGNATIMITDMDASVRFYTEALGLRLAVRVGADWAVVDAGEGLSLGLHAAGHGRGPGAGQPGSVSVGFTVTKPIEAVVETLRDRGVVFRGPISDQGFVKLAFFADPDGNLLYLAEPPSGRPPTS
ncbi:MAG: hypothetical protein NVSMB32_04780 [Actinomycetota bacterium]